VFLTWFKERQFQHKSPTYDRISLHATDLTDKDSLSQSIFSLSPFYYTFAGFNFRVFRVFFRSFSQKFMPLEF